MSVVALTSECFILLLKVNEMLQIILLYEIKLMIWVVEIFHLFYEVNNVSHEKIYF